MKVVILCGGKGTRLREETEFRPKPMLPIGDRPIHNANADKDRASLGWRLQVTPQAGGSRLPPGCARMTYLSAT